MKSILILSRPTEGDKNFYSRWWEIGAVEINQADNPLDIETILTDQYTPINAEYKLQYPNLKYVVSPTTGISHLALDELDDADVMVLTLRGEDEFLQTITSVAEHTTYLLMQLAKKVSRPPMKLAGKKALIVGTGRVGKQVIKAFKGLGIECFGYDKHHHPTELRAMMKFADIVSIHLSENADTYQMINKELLNQLKPESLFINTSRASIVDNQYLYQICKDKRIKGVASDVWDISSKPIDNLIITPHVGGRSLEDRIATDEFMLKKLIKHLQNNLRH